MTMNNLKNICGYFVPAFMTGFSKNNYLNVLLAVLWSCIVAGPSEHYHTHADLGLPVVG